MNLNHDIQLSEQAAQMIANDFKTKEGSAQKKAFIIECLRVGALLNRKEQKSG
ncbi:hypothetical protein L1N85_13430 [Paenibacillus alkaliterrae]|uniref:hypothetical protein n=1 Tax=Paenibacillus alkaliterrae TaxID=320909 RepID=UPI001F174ADC|nr:hypothetical protein [Paenibacillus alkaliterrae]MCF2939422.1 hypothetical protein [Paenibacillus alkaliterrae]